MLDTLQTVGHLDSKSVEEQAGGFEGEYVAADCRFEERSPGQEDLLSTPVDGPTGTEQGWYPLTYQRQFSNKREALGRRRHVQAHTIVGTVCEVCLNHCTYLF